MARPIVVSIVCLALFLVNNAVGKEKVPPTAETQRQAEVIAPLVNEKTFLVAHLDLNAVDIDRLADRALEYLAQVLKLNGFDKQSQERTLAEAKKIVADKIALIRDPFRKFIADAGIKEAYWVGSMEDIRFPIILAIPLQGLSDDGRAAIKTAVDQLEIPLEFIDAQGFMIGAPVHFLMDKDDFLENFADYFKNFKAAEVPALAEAFAQRDGNLLKVALFVPKDAPKLLEELLADAPDEIPPQIKNLLTIAAKKLQWASFGIDPMQPSVKLTVKALDKSAAKQISSMLSGLIEFGMMALRTMIMESGEHDPHFERMKDGIPLMIELARGGLRMLLPTVDTDLLHWSIEISPEKMKPELIATGGVAVALLLPAVQASREAARRMQCSNHEKMMLLAFHNYHDTQNKLPPLHSVDEEGKPLHSWRVLILPYIEEQELYEQIALDEPWDSEYNKQFHKKMPAIYKCPSSASGVGECDYSVVVGKETVFRSGKQYDFSAITDGTSNTLAIVERKEPINWMDPTHELTFDDVCKGIVTKIGDKTGEKEKVVGSYHPGGVNVALFDGSVRFVSNTIDLKVWKALLTCGGGESAALP